jgi:hypothetical protein
MCTTVIGTADLLQQLNVKCVAAEAHSAKLRNVHTCTRPVHWKCREQQGYFSHYMNVKSLLTVNAHCQADVACGHAESALSYIIP